LPFLRLNQTEAQLNANPHLPADIDFCFEQICGQLRAIDNQVAPNNLIEQFITYFRQQWMVQQKETSNLFLIDDHKTNNDVEGWHTRMSLKINRKENLWKFINAIKTEQASKETEFIQIEHGADIVPQRRRQREKENRFAAMKVDYISGLTLPMLYLNNLSIFMPH
jgi:hypothetical protein